MDQGAVMKSVDQYADVVRKTLNPDAIVLFGSYVNGTFGA